jgi:hypothetical protein
MPKKWKRLDYVLPLLGGKYYVIIVLINMGTGNVISTTRNSSTGLCTTYSWVKAWLELSPDSVIMPSARISLRPSYKSNLC